MEELGLTTLENRRSRGGLIETYKILTGKESINSRTSSIFIPDFYVAPVMSLT